MKAINDENLNRLADMCPFSLYLVGGRVRDFIAGFNENPDCDICAPASCESFLSCAEQAGFAVKSVYKATGTVKLVCGGREYEFASFRSDEYIRGEHRPVKSYFTDDIRLDAMRRDFKCNAVYYDLKNKKIVDPLGGVKDIENKKISTVAPALKVFGEDGLRLMRLARIAAQTGFEPDGECMKGAYENRALILDVHAERVFAELQQILLADEKNGIEGAHYRGLKILESAGVFDLLFPELAAGRGMEQRSDFHAYDVLEHSLRAVLYAKAPVRFAALLHDSAKPYCKTETGKFFGHEREGERISREICARLKVSKALTEETARLVQTHMYDLRGDARENKVRKFILKNYDILDKILMLKQADFSACKDDLSTAPSVTKLKFVYDKMAAESVPFTLKQLAVKGDDLIKAGFEGRQVGETLEKLLLDCAIKNVANEREKLINFAKKVYL